MNKEEKRIVEFGKSGRPITHGPAGAWYHKCKCDICMEANRTRAEKFRQVNAGKKPPKHGTAYAYTAYGCRCKKCTEAHTEACRLPGVAYRARRRAKKLAMSKNA